MGNKNAQGRLSARRVATFLAALGALVMSSGIALMVVATPANAAVGDCVPSDAWTETINHPAVTHVVHHDAVPAVPEKWYNFAPTDPGPFDGPPDWPTDARGVWEARPGHAIGGPNDQFGTFQQGNGNGSWFHREPGVDGQPAYDEIVVDTPAWVETIEHPAVTCEVDGPRVLTPQEPTFVNATCTSDASITLPALELSRLAAGPAIGSTDVNGVHYAASGGLKPGDTVQVDATLIDPETTTFADGVKTSWTFPVTAPTGCTQVSPPTTTTEGQVVVSTPKTKTPKTKSTVTPTVVEAGLVGTSARDLRGEQGLALMVAGMVMLVAAGGLGLRVRGAAARI